MRHPARFASCLVCSLVLAVLALAAPLAAGEGVFVVSDIYSVKPDGTCTETADGSFGPLAERNIHWDAASKTVRMYAARNEEVAVQVVIPRPGKGYTLRMSALKGPGGTIPADRASASMVAWAVDRSGGSAPDVVIPLDGTVGGITAVDVPATAAGLAPVQNTVGVILLEVWVPKQVPAGEYAGELAVLQEGNEIAKLALKMTVLGLDFPDRPTFSYDLLAYGLPGNVTTVSAEGVPLTERMVDAKSKAMVHAFYRMAADNRLYFNCLPYQSQRGAPLVAYPIAGQGAAATITSFAAFDDLMGPVLDGKVGKYGKPPARFTLPFNVNYPYGCHGEPAQQFDWGPYQSKVPTGPGIEPGLKEYEETNKAITEQTIKHFAAKGWKETTFEFFHNQKGDSAQKGRKGGRNRLGGWKLDEPVTEDDYKALRYLLGVNRWASASAAPLGVKVCNRLDLGHWHCDQLRDVKGGVLPDYKSKAYDKRDGKGIMLPVVDHWVVGIVHAEGAMHLVKDYTSTGASFFTYSTSGTASLLISGCSDRSEGFRGARRGVSGNVYYKVAPVDPAIQPDKGLDAFLFYQSPKTGYDGPLCQKRFKNWRSGVNDYEYVVLATAKNAAAAKAIVEKMTFIGRQGGAYKDTIAICPSNNPEDYQAARLALAAIATGKPVAAPPIAGPSKAFSQAGIGDMITGFD
jgi:hypothetical protein